MNSKVRQWLREHYRPAPSGGTLAKRIKFSIMHDELSAQFTPTTFSSRTVSQEIQTAFPETFTKAVGSSRAKHVFGIERVTPLRTSALSECEQLRQKVQLLEDRVRELEQPSQQLTSEVNSLLNPTLALYHGPNTIENFEAFSMESLMAEFTSLAPNLYTLVTTLTGQTEQCTDNIAGNNDIMTVMSLCTLLKCKSQKVLGMQLQIALMLLARSTNKQAITVLNHAGVCVSYSCAWQYLNKLATEARYMEVVQSGHWQWVFDNVNLHQRVRHEREDCHSSMLNLTARLAIRLKNLPGWEFDWHDNSPQRSRQSLSVSDILPGEDDAAVLQQRATEYVMRFMVKELKDLAGLKKHLPPRHLLHPVQKSEVVPMKVLFKDEKYISETIDILTQLMEDAALTGSCQMVVGDQMTCKNIRGSKLWRQAEINPIHRLKWAHEIPGDFHFLWECLKVIFDMFWGTPAQPGSLCNLREVIRRTQVDKVAKVFNVADEFLMHTFRAHLLAGITSSLAINEVSESIPHEDSREWLHEKAKKIVTDVLMPTTVKDPVHMLHRSFLHHAFLYIDLREAIRWEDGPEIVRHWKWWIPRFIGTGKRNYAAEAVNMIANITADFPKHIAYLATHNRTVNIEGKPGHGKPVDQLMEHYNLVFKQALHSGGGHLTVKHVEEVSLGALFLMQAARMTDKAFNTKAPSTMHTVRDADSDAMKMMSHLMENEVQILKKDRSSPLKFTDPTEIGCKKITTTTWLRDTLAKSIELDNSEVTVDNLEEADLNYDLADSSLV